VTKKIIQMHFLCTVTEPVSSYSWAEIHISLNVDRDATTDPPTQVDCNGSGEEMTLIDAEEGFILTISDRNRSTKPGYFVEPPAWKGG
jgi:hypothetical protein